MNVVNVHTPYMSTGSYQFRYNSIRNSRFQKYFTINVNPDTTLSVSMLIPSRYGWRVIRAIQCSNMVSIWALNALFYVQYLCFKILDTAFSVSILYYSYQSWTRLYLYQYFTIHINPGHGFICINTLLSISILDTALSVSILYYSY